MFSDLIFRNSRRGRKENSLFFSSLIISIIAFYMILSISAQDVMTFLEEMESDAVNRLLSLIPVFYGITLVILFFLIYFACKHQFERRRHEFGLYLILGMRRWKLFAMLLAEDLLTSTLALLIGLPSAVLLSELVSLVTAKMVGMGIIGHRFAVSPRAIVWTLAGFLAIKILAVLILSIKISRQDIGTLLAAPSDNEKKQKHPVVYGFSALCGIIMLGFAYAMAIQGLSWQNMSMMLLTLLSGLFGTILLFYGMRTVIALLTKMGKNKKLHVFTFRQIQENVIHQSTSMAISSLLILSALCCFGAGVGIAGANTQSKNHVLDYTFEDNTGNPAGALSHIQEILEKNGLDDRFSDLFEMRIGYPRITEDYEHAFIMDSVMDALESLPPSEDREQLLNTLSYDTYPHLICLSDYNRLLELSGAETLALKDNEAAVYRDSEFTNPNQTELLNRILSENPKTELAGSTVYLTEKIQTVNLVTDRSITLSFALILPDDAFFYYTNEDYNTYINAVLDSQVTKETSLMNACLSLNERLDELNLNEKYITYESYLQNMGRQLFYTVAASYLTIYLAIVFLVTANTIMGVQFLMNQQKTGRRYQTLIHLGADYPTICQSARRQIRWFMGLPVLVAAVSSLFGARALFTGLLSSRMQGTMKEMLLLSAAMIFVLCVVEYIYMRVVMGSSDGYLLTLMQPQREE